MPFLGLLVPFMGLALLGRADRFHTVDAIVVAEAIESGGAGILTGDPLDLMALADGERSVTIHAL